VLLFGVVLDESYIAVAVARLRETTRHCRDSHTVAGLRAVGGRDAIDGPVPPLRRCAGGIVVGRAGPDDYLSLVLSATVARAGGDALVGGVFAAK